jgi:2-phosphosulfolactate phosphatase
MEEILTTAEEINHGGTKDTKVRRKFLVPFSRDVAEVARLRRWPASCEASYNATRVLAKEVCMAVRELNVFNLPKQVAAEELASSAVIVIDLLRATTTICYALAAGASEVVPFREIDEARVAARKAGERKKVVLAGERKGLLIEGFDLGNSPTEFTPERVGGKRVFLTTTNGTLALHHARLARRVIAASLVNLSAVVASVKDEPRVATLCAGTDGHVTLEDILLAGAIVNRLREVAGGGEYQLNPAAVAAEAEWKKVKTKAASAKRELREQLALALRETLGGRNCIEVGNGDDLPDCANIDRYSIVPRLDVANWRITAE